MVGYAFDTFSKGFLVFQKRGYVPENNAFELWDSPNLRFQIQIEHQSLILDS
jgi:hypothetical protein